MQELNAGTVGVLIRALTCDDMLVEIVELVGLLHGFDGLVVDMPQPRQSIIQPVVRAWNTTEIQESEEGPKYVLARLASDVVRAWNKTEIQKSLSRGQQMC